MINNGHKMPRTFTKILLKGETSQPLSCINTRWGAKSSYKTETMYHYQHHKLGNFFLSSVPPWLCSLDGSFHVNYTKIIFMELNIKKTCLLWIKFSLVTKQVSVAFFAFKYATKSYIKIQNETAYLSIPQANILAPFSTLKSNKQD